MKRSKLVYGIFTKPHHIEKMTTFLEKEAVEFFITTSKDYLDKRCDIAISYCYPKIIDFSKTSHGRWFNYHPAPLPKYKGKDVYEDAIRDKVTRYGTTLHIMAQEVDSGRILVENSFDLKSIPLCISELADITHYYLFQLFKETFASLEDVVLNTEDIIKQGKCI